MELEKWNKTFSKQLHCVGVRVFRMAPVKFSYSNWEPVIFINTVIRWKKGGCLVK